MTTAKELMNANVPYVFWLDKTQKSDGLYRVCFVFKDEPGFFPTGGGDIEPWWWDEQTCIAKNKKLGYDEEQAFEIVSSGMFSRKRA